MKPIQLKKELEKRLAHPTRRISYDHNEQNLRVENITINKGVTISLSKLSAKWQKEKEAAIDEAVHYIEEALTAMTTPVSIKGNEKKIFPVIRATSFPTELDDERQLLYDDHTAETRVFYAIDREQTFSLITKQMLFDENVGEQDIKEMALFNVRSLNTTAKKDEVAGNTFYFINHNDGYDASKILNDSLINEYVKEAKGELAIAVPHQDVLIIADIKNEVGYDVLGQMVFQFFTSGRTPITALPFILQNGELEPIFILAQKRPKKE